MFIPRAIYKVKKLAKEQQDNTTFDFRGLLKKNLVLILCFYFFQIPMCLI